jgi:hypothetical protein
MSLLHRPFNNYSDFDIACDLEEPEFIPASDDVIGELAVRDFTKRLKSND